MPHHFVNRVRSCDRMPTIGRRTAEDLGEAPVCEAQAESITLVSRNRRIHSPFSNRRISASSSAIQPEICSFVNLRGGGGSFVCPRRRAAKKTSSWFCSSGGKDPAAASISASVPIPRLSVSPIDLSTWDKWHRRPRDTPKHQPFPHPFHHLVVPKQSAC